MAQSAHPGASDQREFWEKVFARRRQFQRFSEIALVSPSSEEARAALLDAARPGVARRRTRGSE